MQRYFLETCDEGQAVKIHSCVGTYHYVRLDAHTVFGLAELPGTSISALDHHPTITLLPSLASTKDVHQHLKNKGREHHSALLKAHGVENQASVHDVADHLATKFSHPLLRPHF
jgi:hypothetical protein